MSRFVFALAFILGATAIAWTSTTFIGSNALALTVTAIIGCVYLIGFIELYQFRYATLTLSRALSLLPKAEADEPLNLDEWISKLHFSLQNAVRVRIEGERVGLPAPVMTPYLVGLLVMLGLLGTFLGMVVTMQGAVVALEGTTELEAIRAGLAAPIRGLGLAFGTSVAGIAASAMLGLISTVSRRDRMVATRDLDKTVTTVFRKFSLVHNRQETFKAMRMQAEALPNVAERLQALAGELENMGSNIGNSLTSNQSHFHASVKDIYSELACSVEKSLKESVADSGRVAAESIKPMIQELVASIHSETAKTHQQLTQTVTAQLETILTRFSETSEAVNSAWKSGLNAHDAANKTLIEKMSKSLDGFNGQFEQATLSFLGAFDSATSIWVDQQAVGNQERMDLWLATLEKSHGDAIKAFMEAASNYSAELRANTNIQNSSLKSIAENFNALSAHLAEQWQQSGQASLTQSNKIIERLERATQEVSENAQSTSSRMLNELSQLLEKSDELIQARVANESSWLAQHDQRMADVVSVLSTELQALRVEESERGQAAVDRLSLLETHVATQLATLGKELEEPMTRLIRIASETPKAAAEVISNLRQEISKNIERDNNLLEERSQILEKLSMLSSALEKSVVGQQSAIESLVNSSATVMQNTGDRFVNQVDSEVVKLAQLAESLAGSANEVADNFAGSAIEMSSLGEAFSLAVKLFNESNGQLIESLKMIEGSLEKSTTRSDEQLGYYIAQAREIIDYSMLSQKDIFEELRQLSQSNESVEVNAKESITKEPSKAQRATKIDTKDEAVGEPG